MSLNSTVKRPAVFLDRDGTLNEEIGYIRDIEKLVLINGAAQSVQLLNKANVATILTTNQSGAARGYYPETHIKDLNKRLESLLKSQGAFLDGIYYCPHLPEGTVDKLSVVCDCRKPETGMVKQAFHDHKDLDSSRSYVIGDKATDIEFARNCKFKGVLVGTGYGKQVLSGTYQWKVDPDFIAKDINDAVKWILADLNLVT